MATTKPEQRKPAPKQVAPIGDRDKFEAILRLPFRTK